VSFIRSNDALARQYNAPLVQYTASPPRVRLPRFGLLPGLDPSYISKARGRSAARRDAPSPTPRARGRTDALDSQDLHVHVSSVVAMDEHVDPEDEIAFEDADESEREDDAPTSEYGSDADFDANEVREGVQDRSLDRYGRRRGGQKGARRRDREIFSRRAGALTLSNTRARGGRTRSGTGENGRV